MKALAITVAFCLSVPLPSGAALASFIYDSPPNGVRLSGTAREYGQTFITPVGEATLSQFTVREIAGGASPTAFNFKVAAWDGSKSTLAGPILYTSDQQNTLAASADFTFAPNLSLMPAQQYIAFIDKNDYSPNDPLSVAGSDAYADGAFAFPPFSIFGTWTVSQNGQDLAFRAIFIPEPAAFGPLTLLVVSTTVMRRRKRTSGCDL